MSSGYDRTYDNSYPNAVRDQYNPNTYQDPYYNKDSNQFNTPQYPGNYPFDQYQHYKPTSEPYVDKYDHVGDFTPFYIAITICAIIAFSLFILNIALGCCSQYSGYWNDRHTGNRWIISLWTATPHKQPALDYSTELQEISSQNQVVYHHPHEEERPETREFLELRTKRESEI